MALNYNGNKSFRLLEISEKLNKGEHIFKSELANAYGVSEKTIQRDIDDLRIYFDEAHSFESEVAIKYNKSENYYYLERLEREWLTGEEVVAISKILLESRAFNKYELNKILKKIIIQTNSNDKKKVEEILLNEKFNYIPLKHNKPLLNIIWELSNYIYKTEIINIDYTRQDGALRTHKVKPVSIMFSEFYFYLVVYMAEKETDFPTVFRIDRIHSINGLDEKFKIPYRDKFDDGEFRQRVLFMYGGELNTVRFEFTGVIEVVLDKLPTAKIVNEVEGVYTVLAEVYGDGVFMWLKSQGDKVKLL